MRIKEKIMGGAVVLLLAVTFLPAQEAWAGERWDKLSMGAKSAVGSIIGAVSPNAGNYIKTTNFGVGPRIGCIIDRGGIGMASRGIDSIRGGIRTGLVSGGIALKAGLGSIPGGVRTSLASGSIALTKGLAATSNTIGKYIGLGAKSTLIRPDLSKMFEVGRDPENGRALVYRKMESRTEYSMTDTRTNKTIPINESVFRSLVEKNNRPKIE